MSVWAPAGPERFRLADGPSALADSSGLSALATPSADGVNMASMWHPDNPLVVWGLLGALTFGLMAFSTSGSVRVGKTKIAAGLGVGST